MSTLPCINCIVLAICKTKYKILADEGYTRSSIRRYLMVNCETLFNTIMDNYLEKNDDPPTILDDIHEFMSDGKSKHE